MSGLHIECRKEIPEYNYSSWNLRESTVQHDKFFFEDFFRSYMVKNLPCLIKNVAARWECTEKWVKHNQINYDYFTETYGDLNAPVADCANILYNAHCKTDMKVKNYIEYLKNGDDKRKLYLKDWHLKQHRPNDNFYTIPSYFDLDWLNEYAIDNNEDDFMFVYVGPKGSWTPLHEDVYCSYSWSVNIVGKKKWILFPPGEENKLKDKFGNIPMTFKSENYSHIRYYEVVQEKGDGLFVPSGWHHQVFNDLNTISINHNWINACNIHFVWKGLQKSLLMVEHQIEEFRDTPEYPLECQMMLKSFFGMDFAGFSRFICYIARKRLNQLHGESRMCLGNNYITLDTVKFELKHILNILVAMQLHPVVLNKSIPLSPDFIDIKDDIAQVINLNN